MKFNLDDVIDDWSAGHQLVLVTEALLTIEMTPDDQFSQVKFWFLMGFGNFRLVPSQ